MRSTLWIAALTGLTALAFVSDGRAQGQYPQGQYAQEQFGQGQSGQGQFAQGAYGQGMYGQSGYGRGRWFPGRRIFQAFRGGVGTGVGAASQVAYDGVNVAGQTQSTVNPGIANSTLQGNATIPGTANATGNATINGVPQVNGKTNGTVAPGVLPGAANRIPGSAIDSSRTSAGNDETSRKCVEMTVILPTADAQLWFGKATTTARGKERVFHSPDLEPGQTFIYKLKARWMDNGQPVEQERQLTVRAGQTLTVTFRTAAPEMIEAPVRIEPSTR